MNEKRRCAFAVCGSFCTLETALEQAQELTARGWELLPVMAARWPGWRRASRTRR